MDRPALTIEIFDSPQSHHTRPLSSPDPEARGRRRRRDPHAHHFSRPPRAGRQSSALRGRCRHRSPSRLSLAGCVSRAASSSRGRGEIGGANSSAAGAIGASGVVVSPTVGAAASDKRRFMLLAVMPENHRRSRSPSRSRSPGAIGGGSGSGGMGMGLGEDGADVVLPYVLGRRRRRQRTKSRSRRHGLEEAFSSGGWSKRAALVGGDAWSTEAGASEED